MATSPTCGLRFEPTPRPEYWEKQLLALDPPPPGAISATEAFAVLSNRPWEADRTIMKALPHGGWGVLRGGGRMGWRDQWAVARVFGSQEFKGARERVGEAVEAGWCDGFSLSVYEPVDPPETDYYLWAGWLCAHSRWAIDHARDTQTAIDDWILVLRMSRQLRHTSLPTAYRYALINVSTVALEMIHASRNLPGVVDARALADAVEHSVGPVSSPRALVAGSRVQLLSFLEHVYVRDGGHWLDVSRAAIIVGPPGVPWAPGNAASRIWNLTSPLFHDLNAARAHVEETFTALNAVDTLVAACRLETESQIWEIGPLEGWHPYSDSRPGLLVSDLKWYYWTRCTLEAAVAMLALQEYRRIYGEYPDTLDRLVPEYLPRLPVDYADRQPLRYRRQRVSSLSPGLRPWMPGFVWVALSTSLTRDSYVLYSIGTDGRDDGGQCKDRTDVWAPGNPDRVFSEIRRAEPFK